MQILPIIKEQVTKQFHHRAQDWGIPWTGRQSIAKRTDAHTLGTLDMPNNLSTCVWILKGHLMYTEQRWAPSELES